MLCPYYAPHQSLCPRLISHLSPACLHPPSNTPIRRSFSQRDGPSRTLYYQHLINQVKSLQPSSLNQGHVIRMAGTPKVLAG